MDATGEGRAGAGARWLRAVVLVLACAGFGVAFALVKGTGGGWHLVFGNVSAPWLVLPVAAGATASRRTVLAGVVGGVAGLVSLVAFYATTSIVWDLVNAQTARNNLTFLVGGACGAALVTAVASRCTSRGKVVLVGVLLACEPLAWLGFDAARGVPVAGTGAGTVVYGAELMVGLIVVAGALMWSAPRDRWR